MIVKFERPIYLEEMPQGQFEGYTNPIVPNLKDTYTKVPKKDKKPKFWNKIEQYFDFAKTVLGGIFSTKESFSQDDIYFAFYGNKDYNEAHFSEGFETFICLSSLLADTYRLKNNGKGGDSLSDRNDDFVEIDEEQLIDSYSPDVINLVFERWTDQNQTVQISSIYPIFENKNLLSLVLELGVDFVSKNEPYLSKIISSSLKDIRNNSLKIVHGNPNIGETVKNQADEFAIRIGPLLDEMTENGIKSVRAKAAELNKRDILTLRGKEWDHNSVQRTISRWRKLKAEKEKMTVSSKMPKP